MIQIPERELVDIAELKVDGDNPNRMTDKQHERLKTSIEKYGFIVPIITNKDLLIADGEQRLTVAQSLHMKQVPIILPYLKALSNNPDIILDLFGGSGSTLIACEQTGRTCYMMEIDPRYCQVIIDRWEAYTGQKAALVKHSTGEN